MPAGGGFHLPALSVEIEVWGARGDLVANLSADRGGASLRGRHRSAVTTVLNAIVLTLRFQGGSLCMRERDALAVLGVRQSSLVG